jgi:predicted Na+-dependent transporter
VKESFKYLLGKPEPLFLLGHLLFPLLGLICAGLGFWLILTDQVVAGLVVLFTITQAFALGAMWAIARRRRLLAAGE